MEIIYKQSPNCKQGTGRAKIAIVNHQTAGKFPGCLSWMLNPESKASAQYLVTRAGEIYQLVADEDIAYHAGAVANPTWSLFDGTNPNKYTIGIEHECYPDVGGDGNLTEAQYQATLELHNYLILKHNIPIDRYHIIGHYEIDSINRANCPGPAFPWERLIWDLEELNMEKTTIKVNGQTITPGYLIKNSNYAPVRALAEALGCTVSWDGATKTVNITKKD